MKIIKKMNFSEMQSIQGGISLGCGLAWVGLGLGIGGVFAAGFATGGAGWAVGGYLLSIVDVAVSCS